MRPQVRLGHTANVIRSAVYRVGGIICLQWAFKNVLFRGTGPLLTCITVAVV